MLKEAMNNAVLYGDVEKKGKKCELLALPVGSNEQVKVLVAGNVKVYRTETAVYAVFAKRRASYCKGRLTVALKTSDAEELRKISKSAETAAKNAEESAATAEAAEAADIENGVDEATAELNANNVAVAKAAAVEARRLATEVLKLALKAPAEDPIDNSEEDPIEAPDEDPIDNSEEDPIEAPAEDPIDNSEEDPIEAPAEDPIEAPDEDPIEAPAEDPIDDSAEDSIDDSEEDPIEAPEEDPVGDKAKKQGLEEVADGDVRIFKDSKYTYVYLPKSQSLLSMSHIGKGGSPSVFENLVKKVSNAGRVPSKAEFAEAEELAKKFPSLVTIDFSNQLCVDGNEYVTYQGELVSINFEYAVYKLVCCVAISLAECE